MRTTFKQLLISVMLIGFTSISVGQKTAESLSSSSHPVDTRKCESIFTSVNIGKENQKEAVTTYLISTIKDIKSKADLTLTSTVKNGNANHYSFEQVYQNTPIYRSQIKVNVDNKGVIRSIFNNSYPISIINDDSFPQKSIIDNFIQNHVVSSNYATNNLTYFFNGKHLLPSCRIEFRYADSYYEIVINKDGKQIYYRDLVRYASPPSDTTAQGSAFLPDPLTSANVTYGSPYIDNNDSDVPVLLNEINTVTFKCQYNSSTSEFELKNDYVIITEHSSPIIQPVTSTNGIFSFSRSDDGFEDVNAFYHLSEWRNHMSNLGFDGLANYQIHVDVHAWGGADQSSFIAGNPGRLNFGEGGVDDAEDADVIIHEYGHALAESAAPGSNAGTERNALDEATGDYLASSYSRSIDPYLWENVFSWDGHNPFWPGRSTISSKTYPNDLVNNLYSDADIWSATIMQIWGDIGRDNADQILLQSLYGYAQNMSMADAAQLYIQADSSLNSGAYYSSICSRFMNRGLVTGCVVGTDNLAPINKTNIELLNSANFNKGEPVQLKFTKPTDGSFKLISVSGKTIQLRQFTKSSSQNIYGNKLPKGTYIVHVKTNTESRSYRLIR